MRYTLLLLAPLALVALAIAQDSPRPGPATITVKLPAEAQLFFGDVPVTARGPKRTFQTPWALEPGRVYKGYVVRAVLERDSETVSVSRNFQLKAGEETVVDFGDLRLASEARSKTVAADPNQDHIPGLPRGNPPRIMRVKMDQGTIRTLELVPKIVNKTGYKKVVDKDGKEMDVPYTYQETVMAEVWHARKDLQVFDSDGRPIAPERLAEVLQGEAVALVPDGWGGGKAIPTIDPVYLAAFTRETLRIYLPPQIPQVTPSGPAPTPKGTVPLPPPAPKTEDQVGLALGDTDYQVAWFGQPQQVKTPPVVCLASLDSKGKLRLRECREEPVMKVAEKVVDMEGVKTTVKYQYLTHNLNVMAERFDSTDYKAYGSDGKGLTAKELAQALARERAVLISIDNKLPDPVCLKALRPGVPLLVLSRPFGSGCYGGHGGYAAPVE